MEQAGDPTLPDGQPDAGGTRLPAWAMSLLVFAIVVVPVLVTPYFLIAALFWAAEGSWDFEGGWRHWLFVKGSRLDRLGLVAPVGAPPKYSYAMQEGTFPGWTVVGYHSSAMPGAVAAAYADRCRAMKLKVTANKSDAGVASLKCEIHPYLDVELHAERAPQAPLTQVNLRVWGSQ